jgi:hypothetical protein
VIPVREESVIEVTARAVAEPTVSDERLLHRLGYAQELLRAMGGFRNFAISFSILSILAGCLPSYFLAFHWGGLVSVTWGWLIVGAFTTFVALSKKAPRRRSGRSRERLRPAGDNVLQTTILQVNGKQKATGQDPRRVLSGTLTPALTWGLFSESSSARSPARPAAAGFTAP